MIDIYIIFTAIVAYWVGMVVGIYCERKRVMKIVENFDKTMENFDKQHGYQPGGEPETTDIENKNVNGELKIEGKTYIVEDGYVELEYCTLTPFDLAEKIQEEAKMQGINLAAVVVLPEKLKCQ